MRDDGPDPTPPRRGPSTLWSIAIGLIVLSVVVSVFTPFTLVILFLPLGLAPIWLGWFKR